MQWPIIALNTGDLLDTSIKMLSLDMWAQVASLKASEWSDLGFSGLAQFGKQAGLCSIVIEADINSYVIEAAMLTQNCCLRSFKGRTC